MSPVQKPVSQDLAALMELALEGDAKAAEHFYLKFLECELSVGERIQESALSNTAKYPNQFLNLLAIDDSDRTVVPVFTDPEFVKDWAGHEITLRTIKGSELISLIPDDWWIALDPGSEVNKEFSPWEIAQLKAGSESIPELVHELGLGITEEFEVAQVDEKEYQKLKETLIADAKTEKKIKSLYLLKELSKDNEGREISVLLLGAAIDTAFPSELEQIQSRIQQLADRAQIGSDRVRVYAGKSLATLSLGMFKETAPFYRL